MIDAAEILKSMRLPAADEAEIQRLGAEIVAVLRSEAFDGRPVEFEVPFSNEDEFARAMRISCALQRRFQARGWAVLLDVKRDGFDHPVAYKIQLMIDGAALRTVGARGSAEARQQTEDPRTPLRAIFDELAGLYGASGAVGPLPVEVDVSVILGTYNRLPLLKRAVASIRAAVGDRSYEVVVTDGGSTDGSRAWLAAQPDVVLVGERRLEGAVKAFNQAHALSRGRAVANFNDDAAYRPGVLAEALRHLEENSRCGQVALGVVDRGKGAPVVNEVYPRDRYRGVTWGTTYANFGLVRREVVDQVARVQGGFWNPVYRTYAGDCELSAWVWRLGYTVDARPDLVAEDAWHEDALRGGNAAAMTYDTKRFYARWPAESLRLDGPDPRVSRGEIDRFRTAGRGGVAPAPLVPLAPVAEVHPESTAALMADLCGFPLPDEEARLAKIARALASLDPGAEREKISSFYAMGQERVLHVSLCTDADPQAGLVRALRALGSAGYGEVRWLADYGADAEARQRAIIGVAERLRPTVVFMQLQVPNAVALETVARLREVADPSCAVATWSGDVAGPNGLRDMTWQVPLGRAVDLTLHASMTHVRALRALGVHGAGWLDIGYDEEQYRPRREGEGDTFDYDVCFLGSRYAGGDLLASTLYQHDGALRDEVVVAMARAFGDRFGLFGRGWEPLLAEHGIAHEDEVVPLAEAHEVYWRSRIGLSVSLSSDLECYSSDRLHRILGCGALALVKRFPGMDALGLEHGVNCLVWDSSVQAVALARERLANPRAHVEIEPTNSLNFVAAMGAALARARLAWSVRMRELQALVDAVRRSRA